MEDRYPEFPGLNLTWEVREGIAKHSGPIDVRAAPEFSEYEPDLQPPIEAQLIDLVDEIAYNHHDIDDGLESGLLCVASLAEAVPLFGGPLGLARERLPEATPRQVRSEALRGLIDTLVTDLIESTRTLIEAAGVGSADEVRRAGRPLVALSPEVGAGNRVLKDYLRENLYRHHRIERMKDKARRILVALCERYRENPRLLPREPVDQSRSQSIERTIADYMAGMTDRYAVEEYLKLYDPVVRV